MDPAETANFSRWVNRLNDSDLIHHYDMFNSECKRISNSLGGRCLTGEDMKKVEALGEKIDMMRAVMVSRMRKN